MSDGIEAAVVMVAGGRSRRYPGGDKALAEVDGVPMCRRVVADVSGSELVVNCRADQRPDFEDAFDGLAPRFAVDPVSDCGPLAGLLTALRVTKADRAVVVACDMPFFDRGTASRLLAELDDAEAAVVSTEGVVQPFGGAYRVGAAREACEETLTCGSRQLLDAVGRLEVSRVPVSDRAIRNCNTPEEVAAAATDAERRTTVQ